MAEYCIVIHNWRPTSVNVLLGTNPMRRSKLKRLDADMIGAHALQAGIPKASGPRRLDVRLVQRMGRLADGDNILKVLLDGCVKCGLLVDDGPEYATIGNVTVERGPELLTEITLTDL